MPSKDSGVEIYVKDTGMGIEEKNLTEIFKRFKKLNSFIQGTGLGLPICKSITEQMEGKIWVESEYGKGSVFHRMVALSGLASQPASAQNQKERRHPL